MRRAEVKPGELVDTAMARIEPLNPDLNAVVTPIDPRLAPTTACSRGVPFLVKD